MKTGRREKMKLKTAAENNRFNYIRSDKQASLIIHADKKEDSKIPAALFGNFLEHLGFTVQGGLLAQILMNPSMSAKHNMSQAIKETLLKNGEIAEELNNIYYRGESKYLKWKPYTRATGFGALILDDNTEHGIPLPWVAYPYTNCKGNEKGRVGHSVRLDVKEKQEVHLKQGIFIPHEREKSYEGYLWVKAIGQGNLSVSFRRRNRNQGKGAVSGDVLASNDLIWPGEKWQKINFKLSISEVELNKYEPVDFTINAKGDGSIWVDRTVLLPCDHVNGFDPEIIELARKLAPPVLRGPGGNFVSGYHFWHGIGDIDLRQTFPNLAWGGIDDNFFGTDEFLQFCKLIGSEPHICVNMGDGNAEEAASWVEYVNGTKDTVWGRKRAENGHPEPYNVRLWEVGNEIYGEWQIGHCGADENARRYREWASAMKRVDPDIELIANGTEFDLVQPYHHWHEILLEEGGNDLECIALHALPHNNRQLGENQKMENVWCSLMSHTTHWENTNIPELLDMINSKKKERNINLAITEWGILGNSNGPQVSNLGGAVYAGLFLNMLIRLKEHIRVANATAILHGGCIRKAGPFIYTDPQVEVIQRYSRLAGNSLIPVSYIGPGYDVKEGIFFAPCTKDIPYLDSICISLKNGGFILVIINRDPENSIALQIEIEKAENVELISYEEMNGESLVDTNTPLLPDKVKFICKDNEIVSNNKLSIDVNPHSITWLEFRKSKKG